MRPKRSARARTIEWSERLRNGDRCPVAVGGDREGPGAARGVGVGPAPGRRATRGRCGHGGDERPSSLSKAVRGRLRQVRQRGRRGAHVGGKDAHGRGERAGIGLRFGHASPGLHVRVERNGDGGQDPNDGHYDHQLDQREAALGAHSRAWAVLTCRHQCCPPVPRFVGELPIPESAFRNRSEEAFMIPTQCRESRYDRYCPRTGFRRVIWASRVLRMASSRLRVLRGGTYCKNSQWISGDKWITSWLTGSPSRDYEAAEWSTPARVLVRSVLSPVSQDTSLPRSTCSC